MIHQKNGGQVGQTISHYPAKKRDAKQRHKILEKPRHSAKEPADTKSAKDGGQVGEVRKFLPQRFCGTGIFRIPPVYGGSGRFL